MAVTRLHAGKSAGKSAGRLVPVRLPVDCVPKILPVYRQEITDTHYTLLHRHTTHYLTDTHYAVYRQEMTDTHYITHSAPVSCRRDCLQSLHTWE